MNIFAQADFVASSTLAIFVVVLAVFAVAFAAMALGVMLSGRCLRGSCGGAEVLGPDGERVSCPNCPRRKEQRD